MAYGFRCARCGYQEREHEIGLFGEYDALRPRGRKYSLESCPGFSYMKKDETAVINEYVDALINESGSGSCDFFPDRLRKRAEKLEKKYWRDHGYTNGRPLMISHDIWLVLRDGRMVNMGS